MNIKLIADSSANICQHITLPISYVPLKIVTVNRGLCCFYAEDGGVLAGFETRTPHPPVTPQNTMGAHHTSPLRTPEGVFCGLSEMVEWQAVLFQKHL